jgi:hypothetical protein
VVPLPSTNLVGNQTIQLTLLPSLDSEYSMGTQTNALIGLGGNGITGVSLSIFNSTVTLAWPGTDGSAYHVNYENKLDGQWTDFGVDVQGMTGTVFWNDPNTNLARQRFYRVYETQ